MPRSDAPWQNVPPPGPGVSLMGPGFPSLGLGPSPGPMMGPMGPMGPMGGLGQMAMPPIGPSPMGMGPLSPSPMGLPAPLAAPLAPLSGDVARLMGLGPALAHAMHLRHSRRRRHQGAGSRQVWKGFGQIGRVLKMLGVGEPKTSGSPWFPIEAAQEKGILKRSVGELQVNKGAWGFQTIRGFQEVAGGLRSLFAPKAPSARAARVSGRQRFQR